MKVGSSIPVIWHSQDNGRGRYNCTTMLNDMFDMYPEVQHLPGRDHKVFKDLKHAVVIVHGGRQIGEIDRLNIDIESLESVLLIFLGDEEASFPIEDVEHDCKKIWIQEPAIPGKHDGIEARYILDGYSHQFHASKPMRAPERDLDWSFAGQVTHERRRQCVEALQGIDWGGVIVQSKGYCQGVSREEYARLLCRSHLVPCPSGPMAQDAARPWEALECGAIPILDEFSPVRREPGFWPKVLGREHPLPVIGAWQNLPKVIDELRRLNFARVREQTQHWWAVYKNSWLYWLAQDWKELTCREMKLPF